MQNNNYTRVLPRDLFNEAKLLKCIGRLILLIHDGLTPCKMEFGHNGEPFEIIQDVDGNLSIANVQVLIKGQPVELYTSPNSKKPYPLWYDVDTNVFDDDGNFSSEFVSMCDGIKEQTHPNGYASLEMDGENYEYLETE
jgi:hypothetical protein